VSLDRWDLVPSEGVAVRLRALNRAGLTYAELNERLGRPRESSFARSLATKDRATVSWSLARAVFSVPWPETVRRGKWWDDAACRGWDVERFFPKQGEAADPEALACCAICPVRNPCFEEAVANPEEWGIRGGTTRDERTRIRVKRRKQK
jgi:WhiB family redox-sensing transcriptional regulator